MSGLDSATAALKARMGAMWSERYCREIAEQILAAGAVAFTRELLLETEVDAGDDEHAMQVAAAIALLDDLNPEGSK